MKKIIFILLSVALSTGAFAQTKAADTKKLENTIADKKADKHVAAHNLKHLRVTKALRGRREVRMHRRSIHRQGENLERNHGVKHPVTEAKEKVKANKDARKGKE